MFKQLQYYGRFGDLNRKQKMKNRLQVSVILNEAYFVLMLPFTKGEVTTLLLFSGWLRTDSGTVIRAGSFPCNDHRHV